MKTVIASAGQRLTALALTLALCQAVSWPAAAAPGTADGQSALALAAVMAVHSPLLSSYDRRAMARLFGGRSNIGFPPNRKISITADTVKCRVSDVDITARSCELAFKGGKKRNLAGREANELYATMSAAGVMSEGAAGSIFESIAMLDCTIDPNVIKQNGGGGANCTWQ